MLTQACKSCEKRILFSDLMILDLTTESCTCAVKIWESSEYHKHIYEMCWNFNHPANVMVNGDRYNILYKKVVWVSRFLTCRIVSVLTNWLETNDKTCSDSYSSTQ